MLTVTHLPMALVYPRDEGRAVVAAKVAVLVESLKALGLRSPITVRACTRIRNGQEADAYEVVAGRHRYEAAVSLKWEEIDAIVMDPETDQDTAELWEIDENFARAELTEAQKADHHARRMRILLAKGLVRGPGRPWPKKDGSPPAPSYAEEAAKALGVSRKTVDNLLWQGKNIDPDILSEITGSDLDRKDVLTELASTPRDEQSAKLASIRELRSAVRPAPDPLNDPEAHEKQLSALMAAWNRAAAVVRQEFLLRIDTPVMDRGAA